LIVENTSRFPFYVKSPDKNRLCVTTGGGDIFGRGNRHIESEVVVPSFTDNFAGKVPTGFGGKKVE